jgi:Aerotolerance regulator N-terminal/von Willebrand factor type A domain
MNLGFASPALLAGALLFTVPLIIHLLNRRRYTPMRWAAQEFLLEAYRKTRRRLTLESLLLLLVRCALVIFLAFALARPFTPSSNPIALFSNAPRNVVLVIDTSYSMTRTVGGESALDRAKAQARVVLEQLSAERGDRVTLATLAAKPQVLLQSSPRLDLAPEQISRLKPEWRRADLLRSIELIDELVLAGSTEHHDVYFFTDLQSATFDPGRDESTADGPATDLPASPAAAFRRAATRDAAFSLIDVGAREGSKNLTVEDLVSSPRNVVKDAVVSFTAAVRNHGSAAQQGVRGSFILNGKREQARTVTFDVPARGVANVEFAASIKDAGHSTVEFELAEDELPGDDRRFLAFPVRESVEVLLVDGGFDRGEDLRATTILEAVLNPAGDDEIALTPFRSRVIDDRRFNLGAETIGDYDLIVLADVPFLDEKVSAELADAVRAGAGLLIFAPTTSASTRPTAADSCRPGSWMFAATPRAIRCRPRRRGSTNSRIRSSSCSAIRNSRRT